MSLATTVTLQMKWFSARLTGGDKEIRAEQIQAKLRP